MSVQVKYAASAALLAGAGRAGSRLEGAALAGLLAVAVALRLVPLLLDPGAGWADAGWPDGILQFAGTAPRLGGESGLVPWGFRPGAMLACGLAALAALPVACGYFWCRRLFGVPGAVVGAAVVALSPELIYFGARALDEVVAGHLLVAALYALEPGDDDVVSRRRLMLGGALLGLVALLRVPLIPALALVMLSAALRDPETRLPPVAAGGAIVLAAFGIVDAMLPGHPLSAMMQASQSAAGVGAAVGVEPARYYGLVALMVWGGGAGAIALLALLGAGRKPALLMTALAVVAVHAALPHKEYRFIYPALLLIAILAGIGCAQLVAWGRQVLNELGVRAAFAASLPALAILYWLAFAVHVWTSAGLPTMPAVSSVAAFASTAGG